MESKQELSSADHRVLGKEMDLFAVSRAVGKGLPLLAEGGAAIRRELERFIFEEEFARGYMQVNTPALGRRELYEISGHWEHYRESMFPPMDVSNDELVLRPMTCPHHFMLYSSRPRSYRDLPLRYSEISPLYRKENSGNLYGLIRILEFHLADGHVFCRRDQLVEEFVSAIELIRHVMHVLGIEDDISYQVSLSDEDSGKYVDDPEGWRFAEDLMMSIMDEQDLEYRAVRGEAAFYGPKVDVQIMNANGREETIFTNQIDIALQKRFGLSYAGRDGSMEIPFVIHRSAVGCLERTIAFLLEKYGKVLPLWLAPEQVRIIPVGPEALEYAKSILGRLRRKVVRAVMDDRDGSLGRRLHRAAKDRIPCVVIAGKREAEEGKVSLRIRDRDEQYLMELPDFEAKLSEEISSRSPILGFRRHA